MTKIHTAITTQLAACLMLATAIAAHAQDLPADDEYVQVKDGHMHLKGKRVRYWGIIYSGIGGPWKKMPNTTAAEKKARLEQMQRNYAAGADRSVALGFNLYRCWARPKWGDWEKGDTSDNDALCYWLNELDKRGVKVWMSALNKGYAKPSDVDIVDDPATADAWKKAVEAVAAGARKRRKHQGSGGIGCGHFLATMWDPRLEAVMIRDLKRSADLRNPYKGGLRLADDPQIVIWELSNEQRWLPKMLRGQWQKMHPFFKDQLILKWHEFLTKKYKDEETLKQRWLALLPGESLKDKTILITPLAGKTQAVTLNDANPQAVAALKQVVKQKYTRDDFNRHRGEDVIEFFTEMLVAHKVRVKNALKTFGKSCKLSPCLLDTGEGYNTQYTYLHQHGDASSICTYISGLMHDKQDKRFPWNSLVDEPPRLCWNVPWIETQRLVDKPFFVYENNADNPSKYRAEWPYLMAALASIQDFDVVCFHLFSNYMHSADDKFEGWMDYSSSNNKHPQGLHFRRDEIYSSAIRAAGYLFRNFALKPAPKPTVLTFGRRTTFDPASMDYGVAYGKYGLRVLPTAYRHGVRMKVDLTQEGDSAEGPVVTDRGIYESCPLRPSENIEYDWQKSYVKFDAKTGVTYVGFFAEHGGPVKFKDGIVLDKITVKNDDGIAYPMTEKELYVAFSAVARDGKALDQTKDAQISLVSTSFNSGFKLDHDKIKAEYLWGRNPGSTKSTGDRGKAKVARPGATITIPQFNGMSYVMKNWQLEEIGKGKVTDNTIVIPNDKKVFVIELRR